MDEFIAFKVPDAVEESVLAHVINEVKNQVPTHVLDVVCTHAAYIDYHWADKRTSVVDWFNGMVDASKDLKDGEIEQDKSIVAFAKRLKRCLIVNNLTKEDLQRRMKDGYEQFRICFMCKEEYKYNMDQVTLAMSNDMDWVNPKGTVNKGQELVNDYSIPLPVVGPRYGRRVPIENLFYKDLEYMVYGKKEKKYALSNTKHPNVAYNIAWIKDDIDRIFRRKIIDYDKDVELGIHYWSKMIEGFSKSKKAFVTRGKVYSN
ncbi:hypothetical protein Tco_0443132 [Tanacetum coccineum]